MSVLPWTLACWPIGPSFIMSLQWGGACGSSWLQQQQELGLSLWVQHYGALHLTIPFLNHCSSRPVVTLTGNLQLSSPPWRYISNRRATKRCVVMWQACAIARWLSKHVFENCSDNDHTLMEVNDSSIHMYSLHTRRRNFVCCGYHKTYSHATLVEPSTGPDPHLPCYLSGTQAMVPS